MNTDEELTPEDLPTEVSRGVIRAGDFEIEVIHLSNGTRIVTKEGMTAFFEWLARRGEPR